MNEVIVVIMWSVSQGQCYDLGWFSLLGWHTVFYHTFWKRNEQAI